MNDIAPLKNSLIYADEVLVFDEQWEIVIWNKDEIIPLADFLVLDIEELNKVNYYKKLWFELIWDRQIWWDYPDYIKYLFTNNPELIVDWQELTIKRTRKTSYIIEWDENDKELVFVKINRKLQKKLDFSKYTTDIVFSDRVFNILMNNN